MPTTSPRYQVRRGRGHWYVIDTRTGETWTGMVRVGARQLADYLNRRPSNMTA
jgi:hypothetical protein